MHEYEQTFASRISNLHLEFSKEFRLILHSDLQQYDMLLGVLAKLEIRDGRGLKRAHFMVAGNADIACTVFDARALLAENLLRRGATRQIAISGIVNFN